MIDTKPAPTVRTLGRWAAGFWQPTVGNPASPWALKGDHAVLLARSSWGMAALAKAFKDRVGRPARVWIPEYFCDQSLWPLRNEQAEITFYPVQSDARPAWSDFRSDARPDLFFLTHFYGHASDTVQARAFCDAEGALLVEDATHALGPDEQIGRQGDVVFYSPWKFLETPNGAVMLVRPKANAWLEPVTSTLTELGDRISPGFRWMRESVLSKLPGAERRMGLASCAHDEFFIDPATTPMSQRLKPSPVVKPILSSINLSDVARRRRANDTATRTFFAAMAGWRPLNPHPAHGPLRSAFQADSPQRAEAVHRTLRQGGIRAEGWPGLPPEVDATGMAARLRRTVVNLPCHQDLTPERLLAALERSGAARI